MTGDVRVTSSSQSDIKILCIEKHITVPNQHSENLFIIYNTAVFTIFVMLSYATG